MPYHLATPAKYQREHYNNKIKSGQLSQSLLGILWTLMIIIVRVIDQTTNL